MDRLLAACIRREARLNGGVLMPVPIAYFLGASDKQLESFELKRLEQAANLERELKEMRQKIRELLVEAEAARWIREHREEIMQKAGQHLEPVIEIVRNKGVA